MPLTHRLEGRGDEGSQGLVVATQPFVSVQATFDGARPEAEAGRVVLLAASDTRPVRSRIAIEDP